jgi:uncharacterized membrane protein (UPF0127 family)
MDVASHAGLLKKHRTASGFRSPVHFMVLKFFILVSAIAQFTTLLHAPPLYAQPIQSPPAAAFGTPQKLPFSTLKVQTSTGKEHMFQVEVARTSQEQQIGLMWRLALKPNEGMLFPFPTPRIASFWMRNTYISLDLLFIKKSGHIANIAANAVPLSEALLISDGEVSAVLELAAGTAQRLGIKPGDRVIHPSLQSTKAVKR